MLIKDGEVREGFYGNRELKDFTRFIQKFYKFEYVENAKKALIMEETDSQVNINVLISNWSQKNSNLYKKKNQNNRLVLYARRKAQNEINSIQNTIGYVVLDPYID